MTAVDSAYVRGETDEFIAPTVIGGYAGAAVAKVGMKALIPAGWTKTLIFIVLAPLLGLLLGLLFMTIILWLCRKTAPTRFSFS